MDINFRTLKPEEIKVRTDKVDSTGCTLLLYKDNTCVQNMLDNTVGPTNWRNSFTTINNSLYCCIEIWDDDKKCWVGKTLNGSETTTDAEKGLATDAMKRSASLWGIGRELYTAPKNMVVKPVDTDIELEDGYYVCKDEFKVDSITYTKDRQIKSLVIKNSKGKVVFEYEKNKPKPKPKKQTPLEVLKLKCKNEYVSEEAVAKAHKKSSIDELSEAQAKNALEHWDKVVEMCGDVIPA